MARRAKDAAGEGPGDEETAPELAPAAEAATDWRMDVPEGWLMWEPGAIDVAARSAAATTTGRAARHLARRIAVAEKEVAAVPGDVRQVGVRLSHPATGAISGSVRMTHWLRPLSKGKALDARGHLAQLEEAGPDEGRVYQHREASVVKVPAGRLVLRNEISRPRRRTGSMVQLVTTIFPRATSSIFEITVVSKYLEAQPALMAELSLMAHSFRVDAA